MQEGVLTLNVGTQGSPEGVREQVPQASTHFPWICSVRFGEDDDKEEEEEENPLLVPLEEKTVLQEEQASLWFSKVREGWGPRHRDLVCPGRRVAECSSSDRMALVGLRMMLMRPWRSVRPSFCMRAVGRGNSSCHHHLPV